MSEFDVLIIGGGPAGTSTGLTILKKKGISVAIIEHSDYNSLRVGESLSPGIRPMLEYLDVWRQFERQSTLSAFSSEAAWGSEECKILDFMFTVHGAGWHLNRSAFDKLLAESFQQQGGVLLKESKYLDSSREGNTWQVKFITRNGETKTLRSKFLVDTSGRKGLLARQLGDTRVYYDNLVGIGSFGLIDTNFPIKSSVVVEACEYGWWYTAPTPNGRMTTILMTDADIASKMDVSKNDVWHELRKSHPITETRTRNVKYEDRPRAFLAHSSLLKNGGGEGWLAVGDSFASHDPLSSSGIPHALSSGSYAGRAVVAEILSTSGTKELYLSGIKNQFMDYLKTHSRYYGFEKRWPNSLFWKRRNDPISIGADEEMVHEPMIPQFPTHISYEQATKLSSLYTYGIKAHEMVKNFRHQYPEIADQRIILGLQEMMIKS